MINEQEKQNTIILLIICIDNNFVWRKSKFFKEIYKDNNKYNRKEYKKWYSQEYKLWKSFTYEEKQDYINKNIDFTDYNPGFVNEIMKIANLYKATGSISETKKIYEESKKNG